MVYELMFSPNASEKKRLADKIDPESHVPTYITISPRKDGATAKTKCLNPQHNPLLKKRLFVSSTSILPMFRVRHGSFSRCRLPNSNSSTQTGCLEKAQRLVSLPFEILSSIIFYLDYISVQKLARSCKRMQTVCHDDSLWRKLLYADFQLPPLSKTAPSCTNLRLYQNHLRLGHRWLTGKVNTHFLQGHSDSIYCLEWIGQDMLVSGSKDKTLRVWDVSASRCVRTVAGEHQGSILCLMVNKERSLLLTGSSDATCVMWSLPDLVIVRTFRGHGDSVLSVCFVGGNRIVTASKDFSLRVWSQETGQELLQMAGHLNSVNAVEAIDEHRVVSVSGDATMRLWDVDTGECIRVMQGHDLGLACARYNGKHLYSGGLEGKIKVWDVETGECVNTLVGHAGMVRSLDCVDGRVVSGSYDRTVKVWDANTGVCLLSFQSGHSNWIYHVLSSGTRIVSSGQEKRIMVLDFGNGLTPLCPA
ncbi:hypothetical protein [Parasitella parasitica]|uniref:F-box domain-containing protein n=1 Tax=Parasitella parasitica TaxID=35722 RepID=A0A0B7NH62_9FUNG|nr:hypothetical protein [Parasitella parasitica]